MVAPSAVQTQAGGHRGLEMGKFCCERVGCAPGSGKELRGSVPTCHDCRSPPLSPPSVLLQLPVLPWPQGSDPGGRGSPASVQWPSGRGALFGRVLQEQRPCGSDGAVKETFLEGVLEGWGGAGGKRSGGHGEQEGRGEAGAQLPRTHAPMQGSVESCFLASACPCFTFPGFSAGGQGVGLPVRAPPRGRAGPQSFREARGQRSSEAIAMVWGRDGSGMPHAVDLDGSRRLQRPLRPYK